MEPLLARCFDVAFVDVEEDVEWWTRFKRVAIERLARVDAFDEAIRVRNSDGSVRFRVLREQLPCGFGLCIIGEHTRFRLLQRVEVRAIEQLLCESGTPNFKISTYPFEHVVNQLKAPECETGE